MEANRDEYGSEICPDNQSNVNGERQSQAHKVGQSLDAVQLIRLDVARIVGMKNGFCQES